MIRRWLSLLAGALAGLALFAIMLLTLVDVSGRKFAATSVPGSLELTELLMVVVIFAGLPLVSLRREHVVFDSLDRLLPAGVQRLQRRIVDVLCAAALGGVGWLMWEKALQVSEYGDTTAQLHIPQGPFIGLMAVLCGVTALVHLLLACRPDEAAAQADGLGGAAT
ncbi:TRAP transporter small permease [Aquincola tertiaricarbonis]|uniref:TRAP transporter small permease n=1 Tax=Aquincola tertiaricarbonis TaxID=391953 RepID=UPI001E65BFA9|nr:TRAP transporter small permease [Aquincola tertiaricarbonis]